MRLDRSQTSPFFWNRRFPKLALTTVSIILIVAVTLGVSRRWPAVSREPGSIADHPSLVAQFAAHIAGWRQADQRRNASRSTVQPDQGDSGIRGQSIDEETRVASRDRELFKPRRLEREAESDFFQRRSRENETTDDAEEPASGNISFEEDVVGRDAQPLEDRRPVPHRETKELDWGEPEPVPSPTPRNRPTDEDQNGALYDLVLRRRTDDAEKESNLPLSEELEQPTRSLDDLNRINDDSLNPVRGGDRFDPSERDLDAINRDNTDTVRPVPNKNRKLPPPPTDSPWQADLNDDRQSDPIDLRGDDILRINGVPSRTDDLRNDNFRRNDDSRRGEELRRNDDLRRGGDLRRDDDGWNTQPRDTEPAAGDVADIQFDKRYLDVVKDNTMGIRRDEAEVFYWLLDHARRVPPAKLERSGARDVQYINLMTEPARFRGEPIAVEGDLWRLEEMDAGPNDYGVDRVYEGWIFTGDSANHPYRVVCTSLPKGIEPGENLRTPVRVTGFFFKREGYRTGSGVCIAPTMLARRITINPLPNGIPQMTGVVPWLVGAIMAIGMALLVTTVGMAIGDERLTRAGRARLRGESQMSFANVSLPSAMSVGDSLRQFAERQRQSAVSGAYGPLLSRQSAKEHGLHDYAASRQIEVDSHDRQRHRQTKQVQQWAARQKEQDAEQVAVMETRPATVEDTWRSDQELTSDQLEPARNLVPREWTFSQQPPKSHPVPPLAPSADPFGFTQVPASDPFYRGVSPIAAMPTPPVPPTIGSVPASNISYGASKLSEWEAEVARMAHRSSLSSESVEPDHSDLTAAEQVELDRLQRDRLAREQLQRQQLATEQIRQEQIEQNRIAHERLELERLRQEEYERDREANEIVSEPDDDGTMYSLDTSIQPLTRSEREELDELEREHDGRTRSEHDRQAKRDQSQSRTTFGWRNKKQRRRYRDESA